MFGLFKGNTPQSNDLPVRYSPDDKGWVLDSDGTAVGAVANGLAVIRQTAAALTKAGVQSVTMTERTVETHTETWTTERTVTVSKK